MKLDRGQIRLSVSDLMRFASCAHATRLDLKRLNAHAPDKHLPHRITEAAAHKNAAVL